VLHYHIYDARDFIKKFKNFKNHSDAFLSGNPIEPLKKLWIRLINDPRYTEKDLQDYFDNNILFDRKKLKQLSRTRFFGILPRKQKAFMVIEVPQNVLKEVSDTKAIN